MGDKQKPGEHRKSGGGACDRRTDINVVILDTAGRLHVDEDMMAGAAGDQGSSCRGSDTSGSGCHDRSGCGECGEPCLMKRSELTVLF